MRRRFIIALGFCLAACGAPVATVHPEKPSRIVSLDYCADQFVLKLADRDHILALSPDAGKNFSYMREAAHGLATVKANAEDVLALQPDLIVRSYGGGPNAAQFFEKAGVPVLNVGWATDIDGTEGGSIPSIIENMADGLGEPTRGAELVRDYRQRLAAVKPAASELAALYLTSSGATTGPGSLVHLMLVEAGLNNFQETPGWRFVPLERLAYEHPDLIAATVFNASPAQPEAWNPMRHPVVRKQFRDAKTVSLDGAWTSCGAWFAMDAIEALADGARKASQ